MSLSEYVAGRMCPVDKLLAPYHFRPLPEPCEHVQLELPFVFREQEDTLWDFRW